MDPPSCRQFDEREMKLEEEEDEPLDRLQLSIEQRMRDGPPQGHQSFSSYITIDDDDDDNLGKIEEEEAALESEIAGVIDLTEQTEQTETDDIRETSSSSSSATPQDSVPRKGAPGIAAELPLVETLDTYDHNGELLRPGIIVEIPPIEKLYQASFLKIAQINRRPDGVVSVQGLVFTRTRYLRGILSRLRNEICQILKYYANDKRSEEQQAAIEVPISGVGKRRKMFMSNQPWSPHQFEPGAFRSKEDIESRAPLYCRWKLRLYYKSSARRRSPPQEYVLEHVRADEAHKKHRVNDRSRLNYWRWDKIRGGSGMLVNNSRDEVQIIQPPAIALEALEQDETEDGECAWIDKQIGQRYTLGDMFSGAGGASCGAAQAGFAPVVAIDHDIHACKTYELNFPTVALHQTNVFTFISQRRKLREQKPEGSLLNKSSPDPDRTTSDDTIHPAHAKTPDKVDVLHLSPPCQFWSPAHTIPGVDDEANIGALFSCHRLIEELRPRLFTLEQTFGILHPKFEHYFNALLHGFTRHGYSVRYRTINLVSYGLPGRRNRLLIIGSCPGEPLAPFPEPTHGPDLPGSGSSSHKPFVTAREALAPIPRHSTLHNRPAGARTGPPWNPDRTLHRTITTHGGIGNYFWDGTRDFTLREYVCLNGFPTSYPFAGKALKRQIGNAFPPCAVRVLFTALREWLEKLDRVRAIEGEAIGRVWEGDDDDDNECERVGPMAYMDLTRDEEDDGDGEYGWGMCIDARQEDAEEGRGGSGFENMDVDEKEHGSGSSDDDDDEIECLGSQRKVWVLD